MPNAVAHHQAPTPPGRWRYVLCGGLLAGTLDLLYICSFWAPRGIGPVRIFQSVAAGWVGRDAAIAGGARTAALGLASHYLIAVCMAATFFLVARRWRTLVREPLRYGALYGIVLYVAMNYVVVPLSAAGTGAFPTLRWTDLLHLAAHMFLVGVPCAWFARLALRGASPTA